MIFHYLAIGLGGALGAIARVAIGKILPVSMFGMPLQILCINVLGCFAIGVLTELTALFWYPSMNVRSFLTQGFLGGFTTFSAFALEFGLLYKENFHLTAILYAILSVILSIGAFFSGLRIIRMFS